MKIHAALSCLFLSSSFLGFSGQLFAQDVSKSPNQLAATVRVEQLMEANNAIQSLQQDVEKIQKKLFANSRSSQRWANWESSSPTIKSVGWGAGIAGTIVFAANTPLVDKWNETIDIPSTDMPRVGAKIVGGLVVTSILEGLIYGVDQYGNYKIHLNETEIPALQFKLNATKANYERAIARYQLIEQNP